MLSKLGWKVLSTGGGLVASVLTKKVLTSLWAVTKGGQPPANPKQVDVSWQEAVTWTIASSAGVGVGRLLAQRAAAGFWEKATGSLPPGFAAPSGTDPEPGRPLPRP